MPLGYDGGSGGGGLGERQRQDEGEELKREHGLETVKTEPGVLCWVLSWRMEVDLEQVFLLNVDNEWLSECIPNVPGFQDVKTG